VGFFHFHQRRQLPARAVRISDAVSGKQLGEVEARRGELGLVERVAAALLLERHLGHAGPEVGEHRWPATRR
jgi:hypothetical protein